MEEGVVDKGRNGGWSRGFREGRWGKGEAGWKIGGKLRMEQGVREGD